MELVILFVCNKTFLPKFRQTYQQLLKNGKYIGDVCLIIGDDLEKEDLEKDTFYKNIEIVKFPNIYFPENIEKIRNEMKGCAWDCNIKKKFQWHKLHVFNSYFKKWDYFFYIDCGMTIAMDITPIINLKEEGKIISDTDYNPRHNFILEHQFDKNYDKEIYERLENNHNLKNKYFATGMMLVDTNIITENTFDEMYNLSCEYPISRTNEQGIIALYFTEIKKTWKPLVKKVGNIKTYYPWKRFCKGNTNNMIMWKY